MKHMILKGGVISIILIGLICMLPELTFYIFIYMLITNVYFSLWVISKYKLIAK